MGILDQGCTCETCLEGTKKRLTVAREKWNNGERDILFESYCHECGDGCCSEYGTDVSVNGFNLNCNGEDAFDTLQNIMEFLDFKNVNFESKY